MRRRIGELWIAFAVIHFVGVTIGGWSTVQDVFADGPINCIHGDVERDAFFGWFFMGVPILTTGVVTRWAQRRTGTLPESMGWITVVAFGIGALVAPLSGAWLGIALGIGTIKRKGGVQADILIGLFWSLGMAFGIVFIALMPGYPPDLNSYLFGNILSVTQADLILMLIVTALVLAVGLSLSAVLAYWANAHRYFAGGTFGLFDLKIDPAWLSATGVPLWLTTLMTAAASVVFVSGVLVFMRPPALRG